RRGVAAGGIAGSRLRATLGAHRYLLRHRRGARARGGVAQRDRPRLCRRSPPDGSRRRDDRPRRPRGVRQRGCRLGSPAGLTAREAFMETRVDEIAERIYRLSTFLPAVGPKGFTFNQFLVDAEAPLLFHCGQRALFPAVSRAVARVIDPSRLAWIAFSHIEADECGALGEWLEAAPRATVTHGAIGCAIWLNDQAPR